MTIRTKNVNKTEWFCCMPAIFTGSATTTQKTTSTKTSTYLLTELPTTELTLSTNTTTTMHSIRTSNDDNILNRASRNSEISSPRFTVPTAIHSLSSQRVSTSRPMTVARTSLKTAAGPVSSCRYSSRPTPTRETPSTTIDNLSSRYETDYSNAKKYFTSVPIRSSYRFRSSVPQEENVDESQFHFNRGSNKNPWVFGERMKEDYEARQKALEKNPEEVEVTLSSNTTTTMNLIQTDNEVNISNREDYQRSLKENNEKKDKYFREYVDIVIKYPAHHGSLGKLNRCASSTSLASSHLQVPRNSAISSPRSTLLPATHSISPQRVSTSWPMTVSRTSSKTAPVPVSSGRYSSRSTPTREAPSITSNILSSRYFPNYSNAKKYSESVPIRHSYRPVREEENVDESQFYFNRGANKTPWIFGERPFGLTRQEIKEKAKLRCHQRSQMFKADYDARQRALETNPEGVERDRQSKEHIKFLQDEYWNNKALSTKIRSFLEDRKKRGKISPGDYSLKETYGPRANGKTFWKLREKDVSSFQVEILPATKNVEFRLFYKKIGDFNWMKPEKEQICLLHPQFYDDFLARNVLTTGLNGLDVRNYASFYNNESKRFIVPVSNEEQHWFVHLGIDSKNKIRLQEVNSAVKTEQFLPDEGLRKIISILFGNKALKKNGEWRSINCVKTAEKSIQKQESPEQSDVLNVRNLEAMLRNRKFNKTLRDYRPKLMDDPYEDLKDIVRKERVRLANELKEIQNQQATYEEKLKQPSPVESADTSKLLNRLLKWFKPKTPRNSEKQSQASHIQHPKTAGTNREGARERSGARKHKIHRFLPKLDTIEENIEDETIEKYIDSAIGLSAEEKQQMRDHTDEQKVAHLEFHQDGFRLRSYKPEARPKPNDEQQRGGQYPLPGAEMEKNDESETPSSPEENNNASVEPDERNAEIVQVDTPTTTNRVRNQLATSSSVVNATAVESKQRNAGIVQTLNTNTNARVQAATRSTYQTRSSTTAANIDFVANEAAIIQAADTPVEARMSLGDIRLRWTYGPARTDKDERLKKVYGRTKAAYGRLFLLDDADDNETRNAKSQMSDNAVFRLLYSVVGDHNTNVSEDTPLKVFHTLIHPSFITEHFDVEESKRRTLLAALPEYTSFPNSKPTRRIILPIYRPCHFALAVFGLDSQGFVRVQIMDSMIDGSERMLSDSEAKELACHFFTVNEDEVIIERGTIQQVQKQKSGSQDCGVFTVINTKRYLNYVGLHLMEMATMMNLDKARRIRDTSITRETLANDLKELAAKDMIHANQTLGIQRSRRDFGQSSSSTFGPSDAMPTGISPVASTKTRNSLKNGHSTKRRRGQYPLQGAEMKENNESVTPSSPEQNNNASVKPDERNAGIVQVDTPTTTNRVRNQSATSSAVDNDTFALTSTIEATVSQQISHGDMSQDIAVHTALESVPQDLSFVSEYSFEAARIDSSVASSDESIQEREVQLKLSRKTAEREAQRKKGKRLEKFADIVLLQLENNGNDGCMNVVVNMLNVMVQFRKRIIDNLSKYRKSEPKKRIPRLLAELFDGQTKNVKELRSHLEGLKQGEQDVTKVFEIIVDSLLEAKDECLEFLTKFVYKDNCTKVKKHSFQYEMHDHLTVVHLDEKPSLCTFQELFDKSQILSRNCEKCSDKEAGSGKNMLIREKVADTGKFHVVSITKNDPNLRFDLDTTERVGMFGKKWWLVAFGELKLGHYFSWIKTETCWQCLGDSAARTSVDIKSMNLKNYDANILVFKKPGAVKGSKTKRQRRKIRCEETRKENKKNKKVRDGTRKAPPAKRNQAKINKCQKNCKHSKRKITKRIPYQIKQKLRNQTNPNLGVKYLYKKRKYRKIKTVNRHKPKYDEVSPEKLVAKKAHSTDVYVHPNDANKRCLRHNVDEFVKKSGTASKDNDADNDDLDNKENIIKDITQSDSPTAANHRNGSFGYSPSEPMEGIQTSPERSARPPATIEVLDMEHLRNSFFKPGEKDLDKSEKSGTVINPNVVFLKLYDAIEDIYGNSTKPLALMHPDFVAQSSNPRWANQQESCIDAHVFFADAKRPKRLIMPILRYEHFALAVFHIENRTHHIRVHVKDSMHGELGDMFTDIEINQFAKRYYNTDKYTVTVERGNRLQVERQKDNSNDCGIWTISNALPYLSMPPRNKGLGKMKDLKNPGEETDTTHFRTLYVQQLRDRYCNNVSDHEDQLSGNLISRRNQENMSPPSHGFVENTTEDNDNEQGISNNNEDIIEDITQRDSPTAANRRNESYCYIPSAECDFDEYSYVPIDTERHQDFQIPEDNDNEQGISDNNEDINENITRSDSPTAANRRNESYCYSPSEATIISPSTRITPTQAMMSPSLEPVADEDLFLTLGSPSFDDPLVTSIHNNQQSPNTYLNGQPRRRVSVSSIGNDMELERDEPMEGVQTSTDRSAEPPATINLFNREYLRDSFFKPLEQDLDETEESDSVINSNVVFLTLYHAIEAIYGDSTKPLALIHPDFVDRLSNPEWVNLQEIIIDAHVFFAEGERPERVIMPILRYGHFALAVFHLESQNHHVRVHVKDSLHGEMGEMITKEEIEQFAKRYYNNDNITVTVERGNRLQVKRQKYNSNDCGICTLLNALPYLPMPRNEPLREMENLENPGDETETQQHRIEIAQELRDRYINKNKTTDAPPASTSSPTTASNDNNYDTNYEYQISEDVSSRPNQENMSPPSHGFVENTTESPASNTSIEEPEKKGAPKPTEEAPLFTLESPFSDGDSIVIPLHNEALQHLNSFLKECFGELIDSVGTVLPSKWDENQVSIPDFLDSIEDLSQKFKSIKKQTAQSYFESKKAWEDKNTWHEVVKTITTLAHKLALPRVALLGRTQQFCSEVYGEMMLEQMRLIFEDITMVPTDTFVDMGSGVGQLVCFTAGCIPVKQAVGIELMNEPATRAVKLERYFTSLMKFIGRNVGKNRIKLIEGNFFETQNQFDIQQNARCIFVNNYRFGAGDSLKLTEFLAKCQDGTRIVSTAPIMLDRGRFHHGISREVPIHTYVGNFSWSKNTTTMVYGLIIDRKAADEEKEKIQKRLELLEKKRQDARLKQEKKRQENANEKEVKKQSNRETTTSSEKTSKKRSHKEQLSQVTTNEPMQKQRDISPSSVEAKENTREKLRRSERKIVPVVNKKTEMTKLGKDATEQSTTLSKKEDRTVVKHVTKNQIVNLQKDFSDVINKMKEITNGESKKSIFVDSWNKSIETVENGIRDKKLKDHRDTFEMIHEQFTQAIAASKKTKMLKTLQETYNEVKTTLGKLMKQKGYCCGHSYKNSLAKVLCNGDKNLCLVQRGQLYYYSKYDVANDKQREINFCKKHWQMEKDQIVTKDGVEKTINKSRFKDKFHFEEPEDLVECKECGIKCHMICAGIGEKEKPDFKCSQCAGNTVKKIMASAKDLSRTPLSEHLEKDLNDFLKAQLKEYAILASVRVLYSNKKTGKKHELMTEYCESQFQFTHKFIAAFQVVNGREVIFFAMNVQEYDGNNDLKKGWVCIEWLDSVKHYQPEGFKGLSKTILNSYIEYVASHGFHHVHIFASAPLEGDDYLFNVHPSTQSYMTQEKLQKWYTKTLTECKFVESTKNEADFEENDMDSVLKSLYFEGGFLDKALEIILENKPECKGDKLRKEIVKIARKWNECLFFAKLRKVAQREDEDRPIQGTLAMDQFSWLNEQMLHKWNFGTLREAHYATQMILERLIKEREDNKSSIIDTGDSRFGVITTPDYDSSMTSINEQPTKQMSALPEEKDIEMDTEGDTRYTKSSLPASRAVALKNDETPNVFVRQSFRKRERSYGSPSDSIASSQPAKKTAPMPSVFSTPGPSTFQNVNYASPVNVPLKSLQAAKEDTNLLLEKTFTKSTSLSSCSLKMKDIATLAEGEWNNDDVIKFAYHMNMENYLKPELADSIFLAPYYFVSQLVKKTDDGTKDYTPEDLENSAYRKQLKVQAERMLHLTENVAIFEKDVLIFPINMASHCATAVVLNPIGAVTGTKNTKSEYPCTILCFNSLEKKTDINIIVAMRLKKWLKVCFNKQYRKHGEKFMKNKIIIADPEGVPQQYNRYDCGPFACNFASNIFNSFEYLIKQNRGSGDIEWEKMSTVPLTPATIRQQLFDDIMSFATNEARDYVNGYNLGLRKLETSKRKVTVSAKTTRCEVQPSDSPSDSITPPSSPQPAMKKTLISPDFSTPGPSTSLNPNPVNVQHPNPVNVSLKSLQNAEKDEKRVLDAQTFTKFTKLSSTNLKMCDIASLAEGKRNNFMVITYAYQMNMEKHLEKEFENSIFLVPSFLFPLLDAVNNQLELILPVIKDVKVFEKDALVIPINMNFHWATAVILNPIGAVAESKNTKSKHPCTIVIFDSNRGPTDSNRGPTFNPIVTKRLMQWLEVCFDKQYHEDGAKFMEKNIKIAVPKGVPQQDNGYDGGPFSCNFASNIFNSFEYLINQNRGTGDIEWEKMSTVPLTPATIRQQLFDDIMSFATNEARDYVNGYNLRLRKLKTSKRKVTVSAKTTRCEVQRSGDTRYTKSSLPASRAVAPKNDETPKVSVRQSFRKRERAYGDTRYTITLPQRTSQSASKKAPISTVFSTPGPSSSQIVKHPNPVNVRLKYFHEAEMDQTLVLKPQTFTKVPFLSSCSLKMEDIATLARKELNNKNVLTFAYEMNMEKHLKEEFGESIFLAPSYLFAQLVIKRQKPRRVDYTPEDLENSAYQKQLKEQAESMLHVTENVAIFEKDVLIFPIHMDSHWATAVILNPIRAVAQSKKTTSKDQCTIVIFNSWNKIDFNPIVAKRLMQWLEVCFDKQYHEDGAKFMKQNIRIAVPKGVPQQDNGYDGGPFSCNFASNIFASFEYLIERNMGSGDIEWEKMSTVPLTPATIRQQLFDDIMSFATNEARDYVNGYDLGLRKLETSKRKVTVRAKTTRCEVQPSDSTSPNTSPPKKRQKESHKAESIPASSDKEQKLQNATSTLVKPPTDESHMTENERNLLMKLNESLSNSVIRRAHLFGVGSKDVESIMNNNSELTENSLFRLLYSRVEEYNKKDSNPNFALYHPNFLEKEFLILPKNKRGAHVLKCAQFVDGENKPNQVILPILRKNHFSVAVFARREDKKVTMHLLNSIVNQQIKHMISYHEALEFLKYYFEDEDIKIIKTEMSYSNQVKAQRVTSKDCGIWCVINTENYMENFKIPIKTLSDMNLVAPQNVDIEEIRKKLAKEVAKISEEENALTSSSQKPFTAATEKEQKLQDATATLVTPPTNESRMTENEVRIEIVKSYVNDPALRHLYLFKLEDMDADEIKNDEKEITVNATFRLLEKRVCEHNAHNEKFAIFHPIFLNDEYGIMPDDEKADLITKCVFFADEGRPERFLLPIYRRFHFALVAFGRDKDHNVNVHLYDSLFDPDATIMFEKNEAEQFAKHYYDNVNSVTFERGTVEQVEPQRRGSKDCGVFLVLNAERVLNKNALPLGRISTMNRHIPLTETNTYQVRQQFSAEIKKIHKKDKDLTSSTPEPPISTIDMSDMSSEASSSDEEESHSESEQIASEASLSNTPVTPKSRSPQYDSMSDLDGTTLSAVQSVDMKQEKERSDSPEVTYDKSSETRLSLAKEVHSDSKKIASEASSSATPVTPKTQIVQPDKSSETRLSHAKKVHSDSKKKIASEARSSATPVTPKTRSVQLEITKFFTKKTDERSDRKDLDSKSNVLLSRQDIVKTPSKMDSSKIADPKVASTPLSSRVQSNSKSDSDGTTMSAAQSVDVKQEKERIDSPEVTYDKSTETRLSPAKNVYSDSKKCASEASSSATPVIPKTQSVQLDKSSETRLSHANKVHSDSKKIASKASSSATPVTPKTRIVQPAPVKPAPSTSNKIIDEIVLSSDDSPEKARDDSKPVKKSSPQVFTLSDSDDTDSLPKQTGDVKTKPQDIKKVVDFTKPLEDYTVILARKNIKGNPFDNVELRMKDIARLSLKPLEYLNDEMITYCLGRSAHAYLPKQPKVSCLFSNTYFFTRLVEYWDENEKKNEDKRKDIAIYRGRISEDHQKILINNCTKEALKTDRRSKNKIYSSYFSKDVLYIPLVYQQHWTTAVVINLSAAICDQNALNKGPPCTVLYFNSLSQDTFHHESAVLHVLKTFFKIAFEKCNNDNTKYFDETRIVSKQPTGVPQQTNHCDCGLFLLSISATIFASVDDIYTMCQRQQEIDYEKILNQKAPLITADIRKETFLRIMRDAEQEKRNHANKFHLGLPFLLQENVEDKGTVQKKH